MSENSLFRTVQDAYEAKWDPPPLSDYIEQKFGYHPFANVWEAYAGGTVFDLYTNTERAREALRDAYEILRLTRTQEGCVVTHDRIRFPSGGQIIFLQGGWQSARALQGARPTRIDGGIYLSPIDVEFFRSRGAEVI